MSDARALQPDEMRALFAPLECGNGPRRVVIACSGGPDSTALLGLYAEIARQGHHAAPLAATVDHGLRPESGAEAVAAGLFAKTLGVEHRVLVWAGDKPRTGLPEAARVARYRLLAAYAEEVGAQAVITAHTRDDQAETVLMRLFRGSGLHGLSGMAPHSVLEGLRLLRPFLGVAKSRLVATCMARAWPFVRDPTNEEVAYLRPRLRALKPALAREGLTVERICVLAHRMRRANDALDGAAADLCRRATGDNAQSFDAAVLAQAPDEILVRFFVDELRKARSCDPTLPAPRLERIERLANRFGMAARRCADWTATLGGLTFALRKGRLRLSRSPPRQPRPLSQSAAIRSGALGKDASRT